jgi:hypothetical protein
LLVAYILPVCALLAPCHPGAALRDLRNESLLQDTSEAAPQTAEEKRRGGLRRSFAGIYNASR